MQLVDLAHANVGHDARLRALVVRKRCLDDTCGLLQDTIISSNDFIETAGPGVGASKLLRTPCRYRKTLLGR
jgi:hypothetical protein